MAMHGLRARHDRHLPALHGPTNRLQESDPIAEVYNDISGMVKQLLTTQPQPAELCPICLTPPLVGSDCPRCGDDYDFC
jgi:hypothetical protein